MAPRADAGAAWLLWPCPVHGAFVFGLLAADRKLCLAQGPRGASFLWLPFRQPASTLVASCPPRQLSLLYSKRKQVLAEAKAKKREKEDADKHAEGVEQLVGVGTLRGEEDEGCEGAKQPSRAACDLTVAAGDSWSGSGVRVAQSR